MKKETVNNETKTIYETIVKYNNDKFDTKLKLTEKAITFERKKGLFIKSYKVIDAIVFEDIIQLKDKLKIKNKKAIVELSTSLKLYTITCNDEANAQKLVDEVKRLKTGANFLERTSNKVNDIGKKVSETATTIGGAVAAIGAVATAVNKNKNQIVKAAKLVKDIIKK